MSATSLVGRSEEGTGAAQPPVLQPQKLGHTSPWPGHSLCSPEAHRTGEAWHHAGEGKAVPPSHLVTVTGKWVTVMHPGPPAIPHMSLFMGGTYGAEGRACFLLPDVRQDRSEPRVDTKRAQCPQRGAQILLRGDLAREQTGTLAFLPVSERRPPD